MDKLLQKIADNIDISSIDLRKGIVLISTPEGLLNICVDILKKIFKQEICIEVYDYQYVKSNATLLIKEGERIEIDTLVQLGYKRVNRVWEEGEISIVGDLVTIWPKGEKDVVRISIFGDTIENISYLDSQTRVVKSIIKEYLLKENNKFLRNVFGNTQGKVIKYFRDITQEENESFDYLDLGIRSIIGLSDNIADKVLKAYRKQGYDIYSAVSKELPEKYFGEIVQLLTSIPNGFVHNSSKIIVLGEIDVFKEINLTDWDKKKASKDEEIFKRISPGDYVVHEDHGIGIYEKIVEQLGNIYLDIHYAGNDRLLIPIQAASKITKYVGSGRGNPKLTGLNSGVWGNIKKKVKESVERIAKDLAALYAIRSMSKCEKIMVSQDDLDDVQSFVGSFKYEDTEDQKVITSEIIDDLSKSLPMDRLVVGDVGFGKTEIAARAAFMVANKGLQVAILTPTTVLAQQHFGVFSDRFKNTALNVSVMSRFLTKQQREKTLQDIKSGNVDIVIGTHALLSDEVSFKNLGLLIIDEEQKFGVLQKEKIKRKRVAVHTLSLTATPIPRTLSMAVSGIRDLSILASVPNGRKSIKNYIGKFDWNIAVDAINREVGRKGQVYYLHNRVKDLKKIKNEIEGRIENISVEIAHGQMGESTLGRIMRDFSLGKIDVLICSTIIENGLDLPNVNTIIIDDAQRYGLAQLYQIRGRVGRSDIQAYAYIMYNSLVGDSKLRLEAISESSSIGSGFILSTRDLEIRGAGNILGKSQSGSINSVGYALYSQMLSEASKNIRG